MTPADRARLAELAAAATPGPWAFNSYNTVFTVPISATYMRIEATIPDDAPESAYDALPEPRVCWVPPTAGDTATGRHRTPRVARARQHPGAAGRGGGEMSAPLRILVTGSRDWTNRQAVRLLLGALPPKSVVIAGGARGLDAIAEEEARRLDLSVTIVFADWTRHGRAAGPRRNQAMVDLGADECWAFPLAGSIGTWDCVRRARAAGILVRVFDANGAQREADSVFQPLPEEKPAAGGGYGGTTYRGGLLTFANPFRRKE